MRVRSRPTRRNGAETIRTIIVSSRRLRLRSRDPTTTDVFAAVASPYTRSMRATINVFTLAVADLERALGFYREGLGLTSPGVVGTEFSGDSTTPAGAVVMFELDGGFILALYPRTELAKDANIPVGAQQSGEFSIGHIVESKAEVDRLLAEAEAAGATVTDEPHDRPWGIYSGYFRDPDGHLWEIIWNPRRENP
jgi:uncharacterized protein